MAPRTMVPWVVGSAIDSLWRSHGLPENLGMMRWRDILHFSLHREDQSMEAQSYR